MKIKHSVSVCLVVIALTSAIYADNIDRLGEILVIDDITQMSEEIELSGFGLLESEVPATINIVDQNMPHVVDTTRIEDYAESIPGVVTGRYAAGIGTDIYIRGFSTGGRQYKDGLQDNRKFYLRDPATIERVEILKGHDSVLFGTGTPGGTVNFITKKPSANSSHVVKLVAGDPEHLRIEVDSTGALNGNESILYRFVGVKQEAGTGRKNVDDDRTVLMPSLVLQNERSEVRFMAEYSLQGREFDFDTVLRHGRPVYNTSYSGPRSHAKRDHRSLDIDVKHQLSKHWKAKIKANWYYVERDELLSGFYYKEDEDTLIGYFREVENSYRQRAAKAEVTGNINVAGLSHTATVGYERNKSKSIKTSRKWVDYTLDIIDPVFDFPTPTRDMLIDYDYNESDSDQSIYLHDNVYIGEKWLLRAGIRKSRFFRDFFRLDILYPLANNDTYSSSLGVTYQPNNNSSYYINGSQSFTPNIGRDKDNHYFDPKEAIQFEAGVRYHDENRELKAGLYQIIQSNLTATDPEDKEFRILAGEREVKGFEISSKTPLFGNINLSSGYSYMHGRITKNNDGLEGNIPGNLPTHSGSINFSYVASGGFFKGMKTDIGIIGISRRKVSDKNKFSVAGYTRYDLNIQYPVTKKTKLNFSIKNVLDKDYIAAPIVEDVLVEGLSRRVLLSMAYSF